MTSKTMCMAGRAQHKLLVVLCGAQKCSKYFIPHCTRFILIRHCREQRKIRCLQRDSNSHLRVKDRHSTNWAIESTGMGSKSYPIFSRRLNACLWGCAVFQLYFRTILRDMKNQIHIKQRKIRCLERGIWTRIFGFLYESSFSYQTVL